MWQDQTENYRKKDDPEAVSAGWQEQFKMNNKPINKFMKFFMSKTHSVAKNNKTELMLRAEQLI